MPKLIISCQSPWCIQVSSAFFTKKGKQLLNWPKCRKTIVKDYVLNWYFLVDDFILLTDPYTYWDHCDGQYIFPSFCMMWSLNCFDLQNNFMITSCKNWGIQGNSATSKTIRCQFLAWVKKIWSCLLFIKLCGQSIFCLPHQPKISDFFDLFLHWVSVVCVHDFEVFQKDIFPIFRSQTPTRKAVCLETCWQPLLNQKSRKNTLV